MENRLSSLSGSDVAELRNSLSALPSDAKYDVTNELFEDEAASFSMPVCAILLDRAKEEVPEVGREFNPFLLSFNFR